MQGTAPVVHEVIEIILQNTSAAAIFKEVSKQKIHGSILQFKEFKGRKNKESC